MKNAPEIWLNLPAVHHAEAARTENQLILFISARIKSLE